MGLFIGFLTVILALSSAFLIFLILLQLPKKEAGAGVAFGGSTADTLFGAGSGNVLTKLTKYTTTLFLVLCLFLGVLYTHYANRTGTGVGEKLKTKEKAGATMPMQPADAAANGAMQPTTASNALKLTTPSTNDPAMKSAPTPATPPVPAPAAK